MANIQGLDGIRDSNSGGNRRSGLLGGAGNFNANGFFSSLGNPKSMKDPRKETFWDMIRLILCPTLTWCSFVAVICIVFAAIFVVQIAVDGLVYGTATAFLEIQKTGMFTSHLDIQYEEITGPFEFSLLDK